MELSAGTHAKEMIRGWAAAVASRDIDKTMACSCWSKEISPWHGGTGKFELRELRVESGGDVAFATGFPNFTGAERLRPIAYTLRLTLGPRKADDGWRILDEHSSEPAPFV